MVSQNKNTKTKSSTRASRTSNASRANHGQTATRATSTRARTSVSPRTRSSTIHSARPAVKRSARARSRENSRRAYHAFKRIILAVIILAMLAVILAVLLISMRNPEKVVTSEVEKITADYYENYFYDRIQDLNTEGKPLDEVMSRYSTYGFATLYLRQLLLYDTERHAEAAAILTTYCNENTTYVRIYPDPPYSKTDYHVDYHYDCNFE